MSGLAVAADDVLRPSPGLVVEGFEDAILIWAEGSKRLHQLDRLAALVWDELDGRQSLRDVAEGIARDIGDDPERITTDITALAGTLVAEGLLDPVT